MTEIVFELATDQDPGFLRRVIKARGFLDKLHEQGIDMDYYEKLIDFLMGFITEPGNREEAREALLDASREQYQDLLNAIITGKANPISPKAIETS